MDRLVELRHVDKSFGAVRALAGVSFDVMPGEVHVLAGENGAGKSTLIRILSGVHAPDAGEIRIGGEVVRLKSPEHAARAGVATIHQELSLVGAMSVADNLALASPAAAWSPRSRRREREHAQRILAEMELDLDPDCAVESLPLGVQQQLEIGRALVRGARVIVMDEPTSALGEPEAERLFRRIASLGRQGAGIVYISHRMEEIFRLADRITVLRDGHHVLTARASELDPGRLVTAMVGRALSAAEAPAERRPSGVALEVRELGLADRSRLGRRLLDAIGFSVSAGEIVGVAGLAGSGASELLHALFGSYGPPTAGRVRLSGADFVPRDPRRSIASGLVLLGNDRRLSLVPELGISENTTLSSLWRFSRWGLIDRGRERAAAGDVLARLELSQARLDDPGAPVRQLSGGNQQKVALARCLLAEPRVLLLDEPTRGIDVAAKADVYALVRDLAARGLAVLLVASELEELTALADRVLVLHRGRLVAELHGAELSRERIVAAAMGGGVPA